MLLVPWQDKKTVDNISNENMLDILKNNDKL